LRYWPDRYLEIRLRRGKLIMRTTLAALVLVLVGCSGQRSAPTGAVNPPAANDAATDAPANNPEADEAPQTVESPRQTADLLPGGPTEADYPHLHNLLQVTGRIYSGGEPKDDEAFAELAKLGVKTVVSVDGAKPNVDLAQQHGLQYVHIPVGYDGVSGDAGKSLASLVKNAEGPFYIHCHHGRHRGPAATAVACIADRGADGQAALAILEKAGTSKGYGGLWRDVEAYTPPPAGEQLPELVSVAEVGSMAAAMSQIDRASDNLKLCEAAQWQTPADHPDVAPPQEALLLKEGFHETARQLAENNDYGEQFLAWIKVAEQSAAKLEAALNGGDMQAAGAAMAEVQAQCKRCHNEYRD
jgi:protein tyrosine phosphatase (PTP) superfamily phosphohydrolase (DUF442 family)